MAKTLGIDVGGTNLRMGVFEGQRLVRESRIQADFSLICKTHAAPEAWARILRLMVGGINDMLQAEPAIASIGIGFPGFIDPITADIVQSPNLPGLSHVNLVQALTAQIPQKIIIENDALAAAYGEFCLAGSPAQGLVYIGLGTGIGGGFIHAGQPFTGQHGVAMEVGHIIVKPEGRPCGCGNRGCVEQYASATGVSLSYFEASQQRLSAQEIALLAAQGDAIALNAYAHAGHYLAAMLASVIKVIDTPNITIGGGMVNAWPWMKAAFDRQLRADLIPVLRDKINLTLSTTADSAGMLGAALLSTR